MLLDSLGRRQSDLHISPRIGQPYLENTKLQKPVVRSWVLGTSVYIVEGFRAFVECGFRNMGRKSEDLKTSLLFAGGAGPCLPRGRSHWLLRRLPERSQDKGYPYRNEVRWACPHLERLPIPSARSFLICFAFPSWLWSQLASLSTRARGAGDSFQVDSLFFYLFPRINLKRKENVEFPNCYENRYKSQNL